jgi:cell division protein FtsW (lipid II flippase)
MSVVGVISLLVGLLFLYAGSVYNKKKHEDFNIMPDGDSLIFAIIVLVVTFILGLLPYKVTKTLLFILAFICFCFSFYLFTHLH